MLSDVEKKLCCIHRKAYRTFKNVLKKENLDIAISGGSLIAYFIGSEFFGFSPSVPYHDKIAHSAYGYFLPRAGDHVYANFSEKYDRIKGIFAGITFWLAGTFGKEIYDSLFGRRADPYDILAAAVLLSPALVRIWRKK